MADSDLEKTEPASGKRKQQARDEGNVPQSKELATFVALMSAVTTLWLFADYLREHMAKIMQLGVHIQRSQVLAGDAMQTVLFQAVSTGLWAAAPIFLVLIVAAFVPPALMGGYIFVPTVFNPKFGRLNPISGIKRVFSLNGLMEMAKAVLKSILIGGVATWILWRHKDEVLALLSQPLESSLTSFSHLILMTAILLSASLALLAGLDAPFQLWNYYNQLKMTKEEVRQEHKEQEGDPQVKGRIRAKQREMARRRMMESVPKADVVVTNPTHFAVALRYDGAIMRAPTVVAKGADLVAQRIRELAAQHNIPVLEAPPLARALYRYADLNEQVPTALYSAVAEVMAYIYQLNDALANDQPLPAIPKEVLIPAGLDPLTQ